MVDEPNQPSEEMEDEPTEELPEASEPDSSAEPDRPRGPGIALLVSGLLVWGGVLAVRSLIPEGQLPTHSVALDVPAALPNVDDPDDPADIAKEPSPPTVAGPTDAAEAAEITAQQLNEGADLILDEDTETPGDASPEDASGPAPAAKIHLTPRDPRWADRFPAPDTVHYTIRHGGTLKRVANLYKVFHHEIAALNPGVDLDKELGSGTRVVIYRRGEEDTPAESINEPSRGSLRGAIPMPEGPGRVLKHIPWKGWATPEAVAVMDSVLRSWDELDAGQPILVGNMSSRKGGRLKPHQSHQSGRDIDLSYPQIRRPKEELNWREMTDANLDRELTWKLLELLNDTGAVEVIYVDTKIQKLLYDWAIKTGRVPRADLSRWLEYPRAPGRAKSARVQHSRGHSDHMHVRFSCPRSHRRCK